MRQSAPTAQGNVSATAARHRGAKIVAKSTGADSRKCARAHACSRASSGGAPGPLRLHREGASGVPAMPWAHDWAEGTATMVSATS
eukprot:9047575-Alexandrium_andersonii.AAC.1